MQTGDKLAHYTIDSLIGRGGMGEVYRARDTRLGRDVALKILPAAFAADPERVARFRREAQTLAALQHPRVASIYGLETAGEQTFLVMELCEGEDLSAVLERGPLPLDEACEIARQIASGLEAAHDRGIVHRDLKPANVKVAPGGQVKILDFGLARTDAGDLDPRESSGETMTVAASVTRPGVVLGTAAYMSPEQARGRAVDRRTDVWAFGVIVWEMLTGQRLFTGETVSDLLAAVLREDIDWTTLPADLPVEVSYLLRRCLERQRDSRLRDIGEARCLLEGGPGASSLSLLAAANGDAAPAPRRPRARAWLWSVAALVLLVALVGTWITGAAGTGTGPDLTDGLPRNFTRLTALGGVEDHGSLDPGGAYFVYAARDGDDFDIFLQRTDGLNPINLTPDSPVDDKQPTISPDGTRIAFTSSRDGGGVFVMGATGESARLVAPGGSYPAWSPDGEWIAFSTEDFRAPLSRQADSQLWLVRPDGKDLRRITGDHDAIQPAWSPAGERIAFWSVRAGSGQRDLWTIRPDGTDLRPVTDDSYLAFCPVWSRDGRWLMFISNRGGTTNAWRIGVDEASGEVRGQPQPLTLPAAEVQHLSLSADGTRLVFTARSETTHIFRAGLDPSSGRLTTPAMPILTGSMLITNLAVSPGGDELALQLRQRGDELLLMRTDGTGLRQLLGDGARNRAPTWQPDGRRLLFYSDRGGHYEIWSIRPDGGDARQISDHGARPWYPQMSPRQDFVAIFNETGAYLATYDAAAGSVGEPQPVPPVRETGHPFFGSAWSPDGRRIAGWTTPDINDPSGRIAVHDRETGESYTLDASDDVFWPYMGWLPDSRRFLFNARGRILLASLDGGESVAILDDPRIENVANLSVARDGTALYAIVRQIEADLWLAEFSGGSAD